jgi:cystathionine beta-lyase/cystathionine gamma-synthase
VALARKYALLEGAEDAIFLASGMAATALAHLAVLRPGDHLISSEWIYGGTRRFFDEELSRLGIDVTYVSPDQPRLWRRSMRKATRAIFIESPTNPLMRVLDVDAVARAAREEGLALLVDATFASPINFRPLEHGADIVITSATKYLNGHSDVLAGAVAGTASLVEEVNRLLRCWGAGPRPARGLAGGPGLHTLAVRMERHNANGLAVAEWAERRPAFAVHYRDWPRIRITRLPRRNSRVRRHGGSRAQGRTSGGRGACCGGSSWWRTRPAWQGGESDLGAEELTSHRNLDAAARRRVWAFDEFLRLSCGLEDAADIMADLEQAVGEKA